MSMSLQFCMRGEWEGELNYGGEGECLALLEWVVAKVLDPPLGLKKGAFLHLTAKAVIRRARKYYPPSGV